MLKLRKPEILPINDHIWLLDDNHEATCYVVAGRERALVIDTSIGLCNIRETAEALTSLPLICVNTHGHGDHIGGNWAFGKAFMNLADLPLAKAFMNSPEAQEGLKQFGVSYPPFEHIEDGRVIDLGGVELEVLYLPGHTPGEIVLLDRQDRILFSGDGILEHLWLQLPEYPLSEIVSGMCRNGIVVTGLQEFDHDISGGFGALDHSGFPLSMIIQGRKVE